MYINALNKKCTKCGLDYPGKGLKCHKCKTDSDAWATPLELFQKGCKIFGFKPTLDAAASKNNTKCRKYYSKKVDSLTKQWKEAFWLNPPYSRVEDFMYHAVEQHKKHDVSGLILVYAKTDTIWWHDLVGANWKEMKKNGVEPYWLKGRVKFILPDGGQQKSKNSSTAPSVLLFYK